MTKKSILQNIFIGLMLVCLTASAAFAQTTAFTYQGKLNNNGAAANGIFEVQFTLFDAAADGTQIGGIVTDPSVTVVNGIFTTTLDFGAAAFDGAARFLEIGIRPAGDKGPFTTLSPRSPVNSTPYSVRSVNAATADNSNQLGGVDASEYVTTSTVGNSFIKNDTTQQTGNFNINGNGFVGGNFGIGTTTPTSKLNVLASGYGITQTSGAVTVGSFITTAVGGYGSFGTRSNHPLNFFTNNSVPQLTLTQAGNFGIGNTDPQSRLEVNGNAVVTTGGSGGRVIIAAPNGESGISIIGTSRADIRFDGSTLKLVAGLSTGAPLSNNGIAITREGNIGIGTTTPQTKLEVAGTTKTNILQITGGSDLAEKFEITKVFKNGKEVGTLTIKTGMVMAIDPLQAGKLIISRSAYNRRVAGVISGANNLSAGLLLPNLNDAKDAEPIALSGRVWVYADATRNPIAPGDLLTTSATPGHAMKVTNYRRAQGAIIGKAMTGLKSGKGLVLVLVTLQ